MSCQVLLNKTTAGRSQRHQSTRREEEVKPARVARPVEVSTGNEVKLSLGQVPRDTHGAIQLSGDRSDSVRCERLHGSV